MLLSFASRFAESSWRICRLWRTFLLTFLDTWIQLTHCNVTCWLVFIIRAIGVLPHLFGMIVNQYANQNGGVVGSFVYACLNVQLRL